MTTDLLRQAKYLLAQMQRLHVASEKIGRCQQAGLSDTGICDLEIAQCGQLIEEGDRLCAEIDKSLSAPISRS